MEWVLVIGLTWAVVGVLVALVVVGAIRRGDAADRRAAESAPPAEHPAHPAGRGVDPGPAAPEEATAAHQVQERPDPLDPHEQ